MKKWFIALFVFVCLPVVTVRAAPPQSYIHLEDYEVINGYYDIGGGMYANTSYWRCSNKIQIPKNVDKLYFSNWASHFILFFAYDPQIMDYQYIGYYHDAEYAYDLTWISDWEELKLGEYYYSLGLTPTNAAISEWEELKLGEYDYTLDLTWTARALDVPTKATHLVLQQCYNVSSAGLTDYLYDYPSRFTIYDHPLIYYPAPTDAAANITFNLMPALMVLVVIAGLISGLIMIMKKSKR